MTALDQAFIKAYRQQGKTPVALAADSTTRIALGDALKLGPADTPPLESVAVTRERVLAALTRPASTPGDPPAPLPPLQPLAAAGAAATAPDTSGLPDIFCRVDAPSAAETATSQQVVPRPHLTVISGDRLPQAAGGNDATTGKTWTEQTSPDTVKHFSPHGPHSAPLNWPTVCDRLLAAAGAEFEQLADAILSARQRDQRVVGIASCRRGEGSTTVLLCVARRLAEHGYKVAMADGNPLDLQLARQLCIEPQRDRSAAARGETAAEAILPSADGRLALLPACTLSATAAGSPGDAAADDAFIALSPQYDMVLVNLGALEESACPNGLPLGGLAGPIDAAVLVQDVRSSGPEVLRAAEQRLRAAGVSILGVVQNCVHD